MLGIIIGVAAVIIMVSIVEGSNKQIRDYYESMGTNKIEVYAYRWNGEDITDELYDYCLSLNELVLGVTPNATYWGGGIKYNTISTDDMEYGRTQV